MKHLVILDFDGTMTDAEQEGAPFTDGYLEDLSELTGRDRAEIDEMFTRFRAEVVADSQSYGWRCKEGIVAPAIVDPYLRIQPIARKILDACDAFLGDQDRDRLLDRILFKYNYRKTIAAFRPHAAEVLAQLQQFDTWVVSNADPNPVQKKIAALMADANHPKSLAWLPGRVHGLAQKHAIDPTDTKVPEHLKVDGLQRPILLRRRHYREVLDELKAERDWSEVTAVGDIFEFDLALPFTLGARIILVANEYTPEYERRFVAAQPTGAVIEDLRELVALIEK